ncbi:DNA alkylation repair protein [Williamwhitmania taraxaci]|uniref:3-methyladenine DNA glycosylase AlkD n=1 Tax=Williamwhitmania taraxaci TaxID=1640674 RepID=A0A1G6RF68_9BACT|nr:DNA alkylation repair protein [Williamwhitmania taraxaci]SDD02536.1 3-methyladenine DNA glycosylase AlkD [Williamwhitmania taraxaci]
MANLSSKIGAELIKFINTKKSIAELERFFQVFPGGYGEGDHFIGVSVPNQRKVANLLFAQMKLDELEQELNSPIHEHRLTTLFILVKKFEKAKFLEAKAEIAQLYLNNLRGVNNWDLVDSSAPYVSGPYLYSTGNNDTLFSLAQSQNIWEQRVAMLSCFYYIRQLEFEHPIKIATLLLTHKHDLIHKAVGWMLREIGNRDLAAELAFLEVNSDTMPRTMLRYAIEKFPEDLRLEFLKRGAKRR